MAVNGGSLEDCFSNVFALTELNGLKWRCFVTPSNAPRGVPIPSDFALKAYGKCIQDGIICTWRRKPPGPPSGQPETLQIPSFTNDICKELWIFWYGDEPEQMAAYTSQLEQINNEDGMETAAPISYEVRTLFFKALHTVIERVLMKVGMIRLGRWFTKPFRQPMSGKHHLTPQCCMAFNMQFFVHGGNTVCMTFNPQRQPTLIRLAKRHLDCGKRVQVILGPWSLRGYVLPPSEANEKGQARATTQWEEWKEFIPLEVENEDSEDESTKVEEGLPKMVTVEIAGVRMLYPTTLICLTLDEDVICQKAEPKARNHPPMMQDELIVDGKRRNPLLVSEVSASSHFQGVIQSIHLSRRQQTNPVPAEAKPFREPFPVQADDETKWNFIDPGRSDNCRCDLCLRRPPEPLEGERMEEDGRVREKMERTVSAALGRQGKRKPAYTYHRRWKGEAKEAQSPPLSPTRDSSDDEDQLPSWASGSKLQLKVDVVMDPTSSTTVFSNHYEASPNSSDDENFVCSPFTPVKCISPCTSDCEWPSVPLEQIPENIFSTIFRPGKNSQPMPGASQEERVKNYDYFYNPMLRDDPIYMSYHSRRQGEKRRSSYPPPITMQSSPEQPGSQETIPATTSPPPEMDPKEALDRENNISMGRLTVSISMDTGIDEFAVTVPRMKKKHLKVEWNDVKHVDLSCAMNEEDVPVFDAHSGFTSAFPEDDHSFDLVEDEENECPVYPSTSFDYMEVDANVENILSPPASNEQVPQIWHRPGMVGPPSVPDALVNQIYPTPPSVQVPIKTEPEEDEPMEENDDPMVVSVEPPAFELVEVEPEEIPSNDNSRWVKVLTRLDNSPIRSTKEKVKVSSSDRFSADPKEDGNRPRARKDMPPDYQKLMRQLQAGAPRKIYFEPPMAPPRNLPTNSFNMTPIGQAETNLAYTLNFATAVPVQPQPPQPTPHGYSPYGSGPRASPMNAMRQMPPGYATPNPYNSMGYGGMGQQMPGQMGNYGAMTPMYGQMGGAPMGMGGPMGPMGSMGPPMGPGGMMGQGPMGQGPMGQGPMGQGPMGMYGQPQMMPPNQMMNPYSMDQNMMSPMGGYMGGQYGMNTPMTSSMGNPMQPMRPQHLPMMPNSQHQGMYSQNNQLMPQNKPMLSLVPSEKTLPEASSIVLAIILQDTILDLHYDSAFDACPICSCNITIRTNELGLYISPPDILRRSPQEQQQLIPSWSGFACSSGNSCNCGFSAVRHRYLSYHAGLFPEDAREATGMMENVVTPVARNQFALPDNKIAAILKCFLDPGVVSDRQVLNQVRLMCIRSPIGKIINHLALFQESVDKAFKPQDSGSDIGSNAEYIVSLVDSTELLLLGNSVIDLAMTHTASSARDISKTVNYKNFFHQWGLQIANEIREPREAEWRALLSEISPALEQSMRIVRCSTGPANIVEGPLTWKALSAKRQKASAKETEDDSHLPEPMPQVLIATEKELIRASPQITRFWEQLSLGPVDQPKDVLYLTVIPDNSTIHEKTLKYMEQLTQTYERMRLGRHVPLYTGDIRDGIIRAGGRNGNRIQHRNSFGFLDLVDKHLDDKILITRLRLFTQQLEETIAKVFAEHVDIFDRDVFREFVAIDNRAKKIAYQALGEGIPKEANSADANAPSGSRDEPGPVEKTGRSSSSCLEELLNAEPAQAAGPSSGTSAAPSTAPTTPGAGPPPPPALVESSLKSQIEVEELPNDEWGALPHTLVIYMVNPFTWDCESRSSINARVALLALVKSFNSVVLLLKPQLRTQVHLEIISLEQVFDLVGMCPDYMNDGKNHTDIMQKVYLEGRDPEMVEKYGPLDTLKATAMSVYTAPRVLTPECVRAVGARSMTKFGPGSDLLREINEWDRHPQVMMYNIPCSPFHLAPHPMLTQDAQTSKVVQLPTDELVLYVSYCLIGGDFLCAAITDEQGRISDNCLINIKPKMQSHFRYRANTQIHDAIYRLMNYIQGVVAQEVRSWRLVIGRLGKIGHGEFKAWNYLLSKTYLKRVSNRPKESCNTCFNTTGVAGMPMILSACLVSIEPEPFLRVFPSFFGQETYVKGKTKNLQTPGDVSATHIMVFSVNTSIDFSSSDPAMEHDDAFELGFDLDMDVDDEFKGLLADGSGLEMETNDNSSNQRMFPRGGGLSGIDMCFFEQSGSEAVQNQPLASGFYVSTAPAGDLPDWFWASCPSAKRRTPVHLKASLHINNQSAGGDDQGDELMTSSKATHSKDGSLEVVHPLDSQRTDEVLRYVLETYNALSWLNIDATTGDRHSCLPIHIQSLLRLYHTVSRVYI